jgi:hypothetical protein
MTEYEAYLASLARIDQHKAEAKREREAQREAQRAASAASALRKPLMQQVQESLQQRFGHGFDLSIGPGYQGSYVEFHVEVSEDGQRVEGYRIATYAAGGVLRCQFELYANDGRHVERMMDAVAEAKAEASRSATDAAE